MPAHLIPLATSAALAIFAARAATGLAGTRDGTVGDAAVAIAGAMAGLYLASKIAR